jgi:hypothetical protein
MCSARGWPGITPTGLPHSEIPGSKPACGSPGLIAARYVLLRRPMPRHPSRALSSLTTRSTPGTPCGPAGSGTINTQRCTKSIARFDAPYLRIVKDRGLPHVRRIPAGSGPLGRARRSSGGIGHPPRLQQSLVEKTRFELATSCVQGRRSPN